MFQQRHPDALHLRCGRRRRAVADRGVVAAGESGNGAFVAGVITGVAGAVVGVVGVAGVIGSAVVFGDPTYDTELRRDAQGASPAFAVTSIVGAAVSVVGVAVVVGALLLE